MQYNFKKRVKNTTNFTINVEKYFIKFNSRKYSQNRLTFATFEYFKCTVILQLFRQLYSRLNWGIHIVGEVKY